MQTKACCFAPYVDLRIDLTDKGPARRCTSMTHLIATAARAPIRREAIRQGSDVPPCAFLGPQIALATAAMVDVPVPTLCMDVLGRVKHD